MTRRRRKRKPIQHSEESLPTDSEDMDSSLSEDTGSSLEGMQDKDEDHTSEESLAVAQETPSGSFHAAPDLADDMSCLSHPSYTLDYSCGRCGVEICSMCTLSLRDQGRMCGECFTAHVQRGQSIGGFFGWLAMCAGLFGVSAVVTYVTAAQDPRVVAAIPGGGPTLGYAALFCAALGVALGCWSQDTRGLNKRAGAVGIALGVIGLVGVLGLRAMAVVGQ